MTETQNKNVWLVKTGDRVLGPFSTDEIIGKLRTREIVVIDEIAAPLSRWRYVRDEPVFKAVADEIRRTMSNLREDTEIQGYTGTGTATELTDPSDGSAHDEKTVQFRRERRPPSESSSEDDFGPVFSRVEPEAESPQYGMPDQARKNSTFSIGIWVGAVVVVAIAAFALFSSQGAKQSGDSSGVTSHAFLSPLAEAAQAWRLGQFERSLHFYTEAIQAEPKRPEAGSRLAPLLVQLSGQIVEAKRVLVESQPVNSSNSTYDREIVLGLAALAEEELDEADGHFRAALAASPGSYIAIFNLGVTAFLSKTYDKSARLFAVAEKSSVTPSPAPSATFMLARALVANEKAKSSFRQASEILNGLLKRSFDYRQEAYLLKAYISAESGNKRSALAAIKMTLETDPELTADHWHDPRLYSEPLGWKSLLAICRKIQDDIRGQSARALYAYCLSKAGNPEEATKILNQALAISPEDALLESVSAYVSMVSDREDAARATLRLAFKSASAAATPLASFVRARLCAQAGDANCAESTWQTLIALPGGSPAAIVGLAKAASEKGKTPQAMELIRKALALSPHYTPAMRLQAELKKPGAP